MEHRSSQNMENKTEECRNIVRLCRDVARKSRVHLELNLARHVKDNKEGFFKYIGDKRKTGEMWMYCQMR